MKQFTEDPRFGRYNISKNNCEHFANYVCYGLHYSSQQEENRLKNLASIPISYIQPTQSLAENINQNISDWLQNNLKKAKLESFDDEYRHLCSIKGFDELL
ncbi:MAG: lecithin retinol acyltransferase family protein [Xenococcaceae cyanobacterium]